jgi:hypothetical protein
MNVTYPGDAWQGEELQRIDLTGSAQADLSGPNMARRVTRGHGIDGRRDGQVNKSARAAQAAQRSSPNVTSKEIVLPLRQT